MALVQLTNGSTTVTLTDDDTEVLYNLVQWVEQNQYPGISQTEPIDMVTFVVTVNITSFITDITKFNNLQTLRVNQGSLPVTFYWNSNESTKPNLDSSTANGTLIVVIGNIVLSQKKGMAANLYTLEIICYGKVMLI